jgi:Cysteine-rich CPCC
MDILPTSFLASRVKCPCCGYPTLSERNVYEICDLCDWEDDGQDDKSAEEVWGGPNSDYSLAEARQNFKKYRVMYAPGRDQRITGQDSQLEFDAKSHLMKAFEHLTGRSQLDSTEIEAEIERLECLLDNEMVRQVQEYERRQISVRE